ncbi:hypothetical protein BV22DRAFT_1035751 [Leucogyrophana mollusca]|uniref:Uncharacterized protein n=1 Tax=Leucogyrophana mollusca TaxID=85980 RepID=A0ACB8BFG4_9AGAM|nr:hypothetical protein BV22DRAFT_1035751 [Leucogyrophana mollusca]
MIGRYASSTRTTRNPALVHRVHILVALEQLSNLPAFAGAAAKELHLEVRLFRSVEDKRLHVLAHCAAGVVAPAALIGVEGVGVRSRGEVSR